MWTDEAENKILFVCLLPTYPQLTLLLKKIILPFPEKKYFYFPMAEMYSGYPRFCQNQIPGLFQAR